MQLFDASGSLLSEVFTESSGAYNYTFRDLSAFILGADGAAARLRSDLLDQVDISLANGQAVTALDFGEALSTDFSVVM